MDHLLTEANNSTAHIIDSIPFYEDLKEQEGYDQQKVLLALDCLYDIKALFDEEGITEENAGVYSSMINEVNRHTRGLMLE